MKFKYFFIASFFLLSLNLHAAYVLSNYKVYLLGCFLTTYPDNWYVSNGVLHHTYYDSPGGPCGSTSSYHAAWDDTYTYVSACSFGYAPNPTTQICTLIPTCTSTQYLDVNNTCRDITYAYYTGNPDGCRAFGGKYYTDGSCISPNDFITRLYKDPNSKVYGGIAIAGLIMSSIGWYAGITGLVSSSVAATVVTTGVLTTGTGAALLAASLAPNDPTKKASNDSGSAPANSVRVSLKDYKITPTPDTKGSTATVTDSTTGKVLKAVTIPDNVSNQLTNSANIDKDTQQFINPIDTTGMQEIDYDYEKNVASVTTHDTPTTTTTKQTSFTVSQNSDGSVLTVPSSPIAPTVSGSSGGTVVPSDYKAPSDLNSSLPPDPKDYTAVLNDIKTNTDKSAFSLQSLSDSFKTGSFNSSLSDGSSQFGNFDTQIKNSFSGFVYNDPLGLSTIGAGQSVPTYSFSLLGQTFVLFDQNLLNSLPLDVIKSILLFVAAISALIVVISFGA